MTHPGILAALARERVSTFLSEAQAARQAGIDRFTALVSTQNAAMAGLLRKLGACLTDRGPGAVEYEVALVIRTGDPGYDQTPQPVSQPC